MKCTNLLSLCALSLLALGICAPALQAQTPFTVNIDTSGLNGTMGGLAFDLIGGDNVTPNNTAIISSFSTDGALAAGGNTNTGTASGDLPAMLTLQDSGFSESFRGITFGNTLSFTLSLTNNFAAPGSPDEFSFFLTDPTNTGTVVSTTDPTGANALFIVDSAGAQTPALTVFTSRTGGVGATVTSAVPEPSAYALTLAGVFVGGVFLRSRRRRR